MTPQTRSLSTIHNIPDELKALAQWVVWRREGRNGKMTKVPYDAKTDERASTDEAETWSTFEQATNSLARTEDYDGIGFVFTAEDPYVGVDLDKCRDGKTGHVQPLAQEIVNGLASYTEVSQSGRGLHVLVKGKLPGKGKRKVVEGVGGVEIYDTGRYFAMTGIRHPGTPDTINERGLEVEKLYLEICGGTPVTESVKPPPTENQKVDPSFLTFEAARSPHSSVTRNDEEILKQERSANDGAKFTALFDRGDLSGYDDDHSRADLALCSLLAFWTGNDSGRIDSLFRQSKLYRAKWDERRPGGTYGSMTIEKALEGFEGTNEQTEKGKVVEMSKSKGLRTWQDIINSEPEGVGYVVEGVVEEGGMSLLIARQKAGKSMLAGQMCIDVSLGEAFLGTLRTKKGPVIYLDFENRPRVLKARGKDLGQNRPITDVYFACYDRIADRDMGLDEENLERLKEACAHLKPVLLVIDPLRLATSKDTNDQRDVVKIMEAASELQKVNPQMGILIVHHLKKNQDSPDKNWKLRSDPREWMDRVHGSQALLAHVEILIGFEQEAEDLYIFATVPRSSSPIIWQLEKARDSQRFVLAGNAAQVKTWPQKQQENWAKLPEEFSRSEADKLVNHSTVDRLIKKAIQVGMLRQDPTTKRYRKVEIGGGPEFCGTSGTDIDNKELSSGTIDGTSWDDVGQQPVLAVPAESQFPYQVEGL